LDKPAKVKTLKQLTAAWVRYRKSGGSIDFSSLSDDIYRYWQEQLGDLLEQFYTDVENDVSIAPGWIKLYVDACKKMKTVLDNNPTLRLKVGQVKQKLGGLRIYVQTWSEGVANDPHGDLILDPTDTAAKEAITAIVNAAVEEADRTCETCGEPGAAVSSGRIQVACSKHSRL